MEKEVANTRLEDLEGAELIDLGVASELTEGPPGGNQEGQSASLPA